MQKGGRQTTMQNFFTACPQEARTPAPSVSTAQLLVKPIKLHPPTTTCASGSQVGLKQTPSAAYTAPPKIPCERAATLLKEFQARIEALPDSVPIAGGDCPLVHFSGSFEGSVGDGEETWEVWNGPLDTELQKPGEELKTLVRRGDNGLWALYRLLEYLASVHRVLGVLFEGKIERLLQAVDTM